MANFYTSPNIVTGVIILLPEPQLESVRPLVEEHITKLHATVRM